MRSLDWRYMPLSTQYTPGDLSVRPILADPFSILFSGEAQGAFGACRTGWLNPRMHLPSSGEKGKGRAVAV